MQGIGLDNEFPGPGSPHILRRLRTPGPEIAGLRVAFTVFAIDRIPRILPGVSFVSPVLQERAPVRTGCARQDDQDTNQDDEQMQNPLDHHAGDDMPDGLS